MKIQYLNIGIENTFLGSYQHFTKRQTNKKLNSLKRVKKIIQRTIYTICDILTYQLRDYPYLDIRQRNYVMKKDTLTNHKSQTDQRFIGTNYVNSDVLKKFYTKIVSCGFKSQRQSNKHYHWMKLGIICFMGFVRAQKFIKSLL